MQRALCRWKRKKVTRWKEYTACLKKKCKRLCDYLIWGSTTLSHWALPGGSSLGNTKIIENTKMVKEMRQSTRTHTYTHARLMKSKRNIYKKKFTEEDIRPQSEITRKRREGKRKRTERLHQRGFHSFLFPECTHFHQPLLLCGQREKKIIKPSCAFSVSQVATSC